ncbi:insulinase family protein [Amphritea sp. HPY]|uniref:insulinase family protein n=1 Tax=Amphritea sp. HPY TaxID=3421652 RepID=UPI003D7DA04E
MRFKIRSRTTSFMFYMLVFLVTKVAHAGVHKSPNDSREYLSFTLPNQMKVLVISDPETDKAAASLDVNVGSNANPAQRQGLAHFLEHMLFLGTEKFPDAGSYQAFISNNGGNHNAYTAYENTNYFFDIQAQQLEPALDRFSQFFISPLFTEEYVERERHAVHSEYQSKLRDDGRRGYAAGKQAMNPQHSYSQFAVGSVDTLSNNSGELRQDLISFYNQYYSANLMSLVVLGKESTGQLKQMVEERFSAVANRKATAFVDPQPLYKQLPAQINIKTLKDLQQLSLTFPVPATRDLYNQKPAFYIATMLGYEGKGSLFSLLKAKGWVNSLSASPGIELQTQSNFRISMSLTDQGYEHYNEVIRTTFAAIRLLQAEGVNPELYAEEQQLNLLRFNFKEKSQPVHYVGQLARNLQLYPEQDVISADYLLEEFSAELINRFLDRLTPANVLITLQGQNVATNNQEQWFNTEFSLSPISDERIQLWQQAQIEPGLATRKLNPFIAEDLSVKDVAEVSDTPNLIIQQDGHSLWYRQDDTFRLPKADFFVSVMSDQANLSPENEVMTGLYTELVKDQLNETLYDALLGGINTRIYPHMRGFSIRISGYNDKQQRLLTQVVDRLTDVRFEQSSFDRIKARYTQHLENKRKDKPFNQTIGEVYTLLMQSWSTEKKLAAIENISLEQLSDFVPQLLGKVQTRMLAHGNLTSDEATGLAQTVISKLNQQPMISYNAPIPVVLLDKEKNLTQTLPVDHNDSAISVYFQGENSGLQTRAEFALLSEIMAAPFYSRLRTEQQLGYVVFETALPLNKAPGLAFVVQSPNTDPIALEQHIDEFIGGMQSTLSQMTEEKLEQYKRSVLSRINRKENKLSDLSNRFWKEIDRDELSFDSRKQLSDAVASLSLSDLLKCYKQMPQRRLTVRSFGEKHRQMASSEELAQRSELEIAQLKQQNKFVPEA